MALKRNSGKCRKKKTERLGHYKKTEKPYENKQGEVKHSLTITVKQKPAPESSQVKRTPPQDYITDFIIRKVNPLVVVDFRFISAFLHV